MPFRSALYATETPLPDPQSRANHARKQSSRPRVGRGRRSRAPRAAGGGRRQAWRPPTARAVCSWLKHHALSSRASRDPRLPPTHQAVLVVRHAVLEHHVQRLAAGKGAQAGQRAGRSVPRRDRLQAPGGAHVAQPRSPPLCPPGWRGRPAPRPGPSRRPAGCGEGRAGLGQGGCRGEGGGGDGRWRFSQHVRQPGSARCLPHKRAAQALKACVHPPRLAS